jgi:4-amino-4-deoxy-L-arabinose transferase-like glycosyltransferase
MTAYREHHFVALILLGFCLLAVGFSLGPIFEGPDELEHYRMIRTLLQTGALPDPAGQPNGQYHQAPLYYVLALPIAALFPDEDFTRYETRRNPHYGFRVSIPGNDNKNVYIHTRDETFPYAQNSAARAVHGVRLVSVVIGVGMVLASYAVFRELWPDRPERRLLALSIVGFWPQLAFISGIVSNDGLSCLMVTLALWLVVRQQRRGASRRRAAWLGVVLGAALLTKSTVAMLVFPMGLVTVLDRRTWRYAPITLALVAAIAGWWYVRNAVLYGDPTGIQSALRAWPSQVIRPGQVALDVGLGNSVYTYFSVWARFGYGSVTVSSWMYRCFDLLVFLSVSGALIIALRRWRERRQVVLQSMTVTSFALLWVVAVIFGSSVALSGNQGRYLLPGLAAWAAIQTVGLEAWMIPRLRQRIAITLSLALAVLSVISLFGYFYPAYRVLPVPAAIPQPLAIRYGDVAELIGMSLDDVQVHPGETVRLELYWQALQPGQLAVHLQTEPTMESIERVSLPGNGHRPATDWLPGDRWAERYDLIIPDDLAEGTRIRLVISLIDLATGESLPTSTEAVIGELVIVG